MNILVVGSVALDSIKTPFGEKNDLLGGSATYFSCAASLFTKVRIVGVVGDDFPEKHVAMLKKKGVDTCGLRVCKGLTFRWTGSYGDNMNEAKTLSVCLNVMGQFSPKIPEEYKSSEYVFLANIDPDIQAAVLKQVRAPKLVVCDTMNLWIENKLPQLKKLLRKIDILLINDGEARMLTGEKNLVKAGRLILSLGPKAAIVKKGEHGVLLVTKRNFFAIPAFPLEKVLDPTGAGDSFGGGFMGYIASTGNTSDENLRKAIVYGTVTASFAVQGFGLSRLQNVKRKEIKERFRQMQRLVRF